MAVFKCKMCGGALEINENQTVAVCEYCGTQQTLPKLSDDKRANLYDRANHFRRNNEFDKAIGIYEQILNEDGTDAEAYWSLVLCRYGIEYVDDPVSHKRIPTVNRAQFTSIFDDDNYKSALQYADGNQKVIYEDEANAINEIQKGILAISQKEEPFDVFICYKETDNNGRRTQDSVLANDLYHQLTQEGFKVFFSRITLEDKLGVAYEPYIFAALNSSKVMVVLGTKPDYFNAVWVKNEWSRYLALIKNGAKKILIPAYRDMDPYDLPEEFSHLQAQDMSKLGFMQDLIRGIKKIVGADELKAQTKTVISAGTNTAALIKRAFIFLEDRNWNNADEYFEKVLDEDPENAMAYLGKMMIELQVSTQEDLVNCHSPFDTSSYYEKTLRYADPTLKNTLTGYITTINERNEHNRLEGLYNEAKALMDSADDEDSYIEAAEKFDDISDYLNSAELAEKCRNAAKVAHDEEIYQDACGLEKREAIDMATEVSYLERAVSKFKTIPEYKDASDKVTELQLKIEELNKKIEIQRKRNKKIAIIVSAAIAIIIAFLIVLFNVIIPAVKYSSANKCVENKEYLEAVSIYEELADYKDSAEKAVSARYLLATTQLENKEYQSAYENFSLIKDYEDSKDKYQTAGIGYAQAEISAKKYQSAIDILGTVGTFEDKSAMLDQCYTEGAKEFYADKQYYSALTWYQRVTRYDKNADFYTDSCYKYAVECINDGDYSSALTYLDKAGNRDGVAEQKKAAKYGYVNANKNNSNTTTFEYLKELKAANYKDSASIYKDLYSWKVDIVVNDSEDDEKTDMSSISKYSNWYFHVNLSGGEPGAEIQVKYTGYFPDGETNSGKWDSKWSDGWGGTCWFYYNTPVYGQQGTFKLKVFDGSGNLLGEKSVKITG